MLLTSLHNFWLYLDNSWQEGVLASMHYLCELAVLISSTRRSITARVWQPLLCSFYNLLVRSNCVSELVQKLTKEQPIIASLRPTTLEQLEAAVDRKYVPIKFTETRGGTELGIRLDSERSDLSKANFEAGTGIIHIVGELVLDYVPVWFHGDIDLGSLAGTGRLEILPEKSAHKAAVSASSSA